jgi:radical SAM superfamily enzyme YgiQ (UPF0313 family)
MIKIDAAPKTKVLFVVYDNDSFINWFPQGISYLISYVSSKLRGVRFDIFPMDVRHDSSDKLKSFLDKNYYDVVAISVIAGYYQYKKLLELSLAIKGSKNSPGLYVLGGHGPSPEPEFFLEKTGADVIVQGEGEETFVELLDCFGSPGMFSIPGTVWNSGGNIIKNPRRELIKDIDSIPFPAWDRFNMEYYRLLRMPLAENSDFCFPILSGRGCKYKCNFCFRLDKGFRPRSSEAIVDEIRYLKEHYGINYFVFSDELLMSSRERTIELCESFLQSGIKFKWWCNGRLNYASTDVLEIMKRAGCVFINYGIESYDNEMLKVMKKGLNTDQIQRGVENTIAEGISPGLNIIFGNVGETKEILWKGVAFLRKYADHSQLRTIRPVTPYPGCPLYYQAIEKGLLTGPEDFYTKHINSDLLSVNFTDMTDEEVHSEICKANKVLVEDHAENKLDVLLKQMDLIYSKKDPSFRGYRSY